MTAKVPRMPRYGSDRLWPTLAQSCCVWPKGGGLPPNQRVIGSSPMGGAHVKPYITTVYGFLFCGISCNTWALQHFLQHFGPAKGKVHNRRYGGCRRMGLIVLRAVPQTPSGAPQLPHSLRVSARPTKGLSPLF